MTSTPQKPAASSAADVGYREVPLAGLSYSPLSSAPASDVEPRRSFLARLAAASAAAAFNKQTKIAGDDAATGAPAVPQALAPPSAAAADNDDGSAASYANVPSRSPCVRRSSVDDTLNNRETHSGRNISNSVGVCGPIGEVVDLDNHPLDLTAKTSVTLAPTEPEHQPDVFQPSERDVTGTGNNSLQLPVRKVSRRKGVAHKLDTTAVNRWPPADVTNEPFELVVPVSTSPKSVSASELTVYRRVSSPRRSSPTDRDYRSSGNTIQCVDETDAGDRTEGEMSDTTSSGGLQRQPEMAAGSRGYAAAADKGDAAADGDDAGQAGQAADWTPAAVGLRRVDECRHCGFVFKHPAMFDIHMGFHKFDEPWRCNRCGHRCTDCVDFNRHIATAAHLGDEQAH